MITNVSNEVKDKLYDAIIHRSPRMAMIALATEKDFKNLQFRELALIKLLFDQTSEKRYPETNLIFMLDISSPTNGL